MNDKPLTVTEIKLMEKEGWERFKQSDQYKKSEVALAKLHCDLLNPLIRRTRRLLLEAALKGSDRGILNYCISKAIMPHSIKMATYGTVAIDSKKITKRVWHWYLRLQKIKANRPNDT